MPALIEKTIDYAAEIKRLKTERKAVILAHNYQRPEIQDLADFVGDSLGLSRKAQETSAEVIVFCGVHFMAETASILNPAKKVVLPDLLAGCSMADMISVDVLLDLKEKHPDALVVSYVNTTADIKAESDICCTSSNARQVVESLPKDREVIFVPDKYLGAWVAAQTGRKMILYEGWCPIHMEIKEFGVDILQREHPQAWLVSHPEAPTEVSSKARIVTSTEGMIAACRDAPAREFIIATESGILHKLRKECPDKVFYAANDLAICPYMKRNDLEKVWLSLRDLKPEVKVPEAVRERAWQPIQRMLELNLPYQENFVGCKC
jgi:quinolinate synthase